jgi:hypothetical protein
MTPLRFSTAIAARLLGLSIPSFNALGLVPVPYCQRHKRYSREGIELVLGHPITAEMVAEAEAAHASRKASYAHQNQKRLREANAHV